MKKENGKRLKSRVLVGAMACLMAVSMAGCGQEVEAEEEKSFGERVEDEIFPDHEEVQSQVEDEIIAELHESLHGDEAETETGLW